MDTDIVFLAILMGDLALWTLPAYAMSAPGTSSEEFLNLGFGARPEAMGNAFTGLADDVNAIAYNPAGLAFLPNQEVSLTDNEYIQNTRQEQMAYALPSQGFGTLGLSANLLQVAPFASYDVNDVPAGNISAQDMALGAAYAYGIGNLGFGFRGQYLHSTLDSVAASGTSWDAGGLYKLKSSETESFSIGAAITNVGPGFQFIQQAFPLPLTEKVGAAYSTQLWDKESRLTVTADIGFPRGGSQYISGGLEFTPLEIACLRLGYQGYQEAGIGFTGGLGLHVIRRGYSWLSASDYPAGFPDIDLDYSIMPLGGLGYAQEASLTFFFNSSSEDSAYQNGKKARKPKGWGMSYESLP